MSVIAIIPARMGSARMPWKNRMEIDAGINLAQHAVDCARGSGQVDHIIVSTDEPENLPIRFAHVSMRPHALSGSTADISAVVQHTLIEAERLRKQTFDLVVVLQPAVIARSPLIVRRMIETMQQQPQLRGMVTMAKAHPWIWRGDTATGTARASWVPGPYPRSQDAGPHWVEINAVQITTREIALAGRRWDAPLAIAELPSWTQSLDIDTPADFNEARDLWPWARLRLETYEPTFAICNAIGPDTHYKTA